jgi:hypothetical protein
VARIDGADQALYRIHGNNMHLRLATEGWLPHLKGRQAVYDVLPDLEPSVTVTNDDRIASRRALADFATRYARAELQSRDSAKRQLGVQYARYAKEVFPPIVHTQSWDGLEARCSAAAGPWWAPLAEGKRKVRSTLGGVVNRHMRRW